MGVNPGRGLLLATMSLLVVAAFATRPAASGVPGEPKVVVSLTFDDARRDQLRALAPLDAHGMHATFYIVTGLLGGAEYMNWDDLQALAADGQEIGGHTVTHPPLTTLSPAAQRHEVCDGRAALAERALGPIVSFAYPFGDNNAAVWAVVQSCGYLSARRTGGIGPTGCNRCPLAEAIPPYTPLNPWTLRTPPVIDEGTTLAMMEQYVTQAEDSGGGWVILVFHGLCDGCGRWSTTLQQFTALLDWLQPRAARGTVVRTVGEVMNPPGSDSDAGLPDATTGPARRVGTTTATLNGAVNPNGVPTTWHYEYGTTTSYGSATASTSARAGTARVRVSARLTGLTRGTTYHYCLVATSSAGSTRGADGSFTTPLQRLRRP